MPGSPLSRVAGPIAIVAGLLVIVTRLVTILTVPAELGPLKDYVLTPTHAINSVASIVAFALLVLALVAMYEREAIAAGALGIVGFAAAIIGTVFMAGDWWYEAFAVPRIAEVAPDAIETFVGGRLLIGGLSSFALLGIGWVLFGLSSLRAGVFPPAMSLGIVAGGVLSGIPIGIVYVTGGVVLGVTVAWWGIWTLRQTTMARDAAERSTIRNARGVG